jgi:hypothetical protein
MIASIVPFPIQFNKRNNSPSFRIEQIDKKEGDENTEQDCKTLT